MKKVSLICAAVLLSSLLLSSCKSSTHCQAYQSSIVKVEKNKAL